MSMKSTLNLSTLEFEKKCKVRIGVSAGIILLGILALAASYFYGSGFYTILPTADNHAEFIRGFYTGSGSGLIAAGIITIIKNYRYLHNVELKKKQSLIEGDERNQMIGRKCWAYAGYALFLCLYAGILVAGAISFEVLATLLIVLAVYGLLLLIFYIVLQRIM